VNISKKSLLSRCPNKDDQIIIRVDVGTKAKFKKWCESNDTRMTNVLENVIHHILDNDSEFLEEKDVV
jgi:hypothetical protein